MSDMIVLAMHGAPPRDFPPAEMMELFDLHFRVEHAHGPIAPEMAVRHAALEARMRDWPRTPQNDPFYTASFELAAALETATGRPVIVGFNEFCAPDLEQTLDQAVAKGASRIIVVTPMMTRGGEHAERDIPAVIRGAAARHSNVEIIYAWPFEIPAIANFLGGQIAGFLK